MMSQNSQGNTCDEMKSFSFSFRCAAVSTIRSSGPEVFCKKVVLNLFRIGLFGAAHGWGGGVQKSSPPTKLWHISYNVEIGHSYILPKEDPKNIWITWHTPAALLTSAFFHQKPANFAISRNTDIDCVLMHNFSFF